MMYATGNPSLQSVLFLLTIPSVLHVVMFLVPSFAGFSRPHFFNSSIFPRIRAFCRDFVLYIDVRSGRALITSDSDFSTLLMLNLTRQAGLSFPCFA